MADTVNVTEETLEATVERAFKFIRAIGLIARVRGRMQARGYEPEDHSSGWALLTAVSGQTEIQPPIPEAGDVRDAFAELNRADEVLFGLLTASLTHRYPAALKTLTTGLSTTRDEAEAVVVVSTLLDRFNALEKSGTDEAKKVIEYLKKMN